MNRTPGKLIFGSREEGAGSGTSVPGWCDRVSRSGRNGFFGFRRWLGGGRHELGLFQHPVQGQQEHEPVSQAAQAAQMLLTGPGTEAWRRLDLVWRQLDHLAHGVDYQSD